MRISLTFAKIPQINYVAHRRTEMAWHVTGYHAGYRGTTFKGNILFIDPVIDPTTRVSKVRVEISNRSGKLKPEMFATGMVHANLSDFKDKLVIPGSAVLWTGKRSIVYVKQKESSDLIFKLREVELGPALGESYIIVSGLNEGEEIVTQGAFNVDAAAQIEGKSSMMDSNNGLIPDQKDHHDMKM